MFRKSHSRNFDGSLEFMFAVDERRDLRKSAPGFD